MKRLVVSMAVIAIALTNASPAFAQSKDLAGTWLLDVEKSGRKDGPQTIVLTLTDKEFIGRVGGAAAPPFTFKLDGTESTMKDGAKTKASWKGNKLEATVISAQGATETLTFYRDGAWLVMEGLSPEQGAMKFFFKKDPGKL
jgi:hypothetical protein